MDPKLTQVFWGFPDGEHLLRVAARLLIAALFGSILGLERLRQRKQAGMRTHMLVALGSALLIVVPAELSLTPADLSRVIQGIVTGIGFLGGGTILKLSQEHEIRGLTTAAGIWLTAGIGVTVGLGAIWPALIGTLFGWVILGWMGYLEHWFQGKQSEPPRN
jgi:putative Mg2+ transporter-C (MgtC) family protein